MKHVLILCCFILLLVNSVVGISLTAGDVSVLYTIQQCDGPLLIKATSDSGMHVDDMNIEKCVQQDVQEWECSCSDGFDITVWPDKNTDKEYNFIIQYYLEYSSENMDVNLSTSQQELKHDAYKSVKKINNVVITPKEKVRETFSLTSETKRVIVFVVLFFILIFSILIFKSDKLFIGNGKNYDVLNYKTTNEKGFEDDVQDILNNIK